MDADKEEEPDMAKPDDAMEVDDEEEEKFFEVEEKNLKQRQPAMAPKPKAKGSG